MSTGRLTRWGGALPVVILAAACSSGEIHEPWVPEYKESLVAQERVRSEAVAEQLDHRLRYNMADR